MKHPRFDPGALRHRMKLLEQVRVHDEVGGYSEDWVEKAMIWAFAQPLSAQERFRARANEVDVTHRITMRYRSDIAPTMRLSMRGRQFDVVSIIDPDESRRYLTVQATESQAP